MGKTCRADDGTNQLHREQLATQRARLELVRRLDQARTQANTHYKKDIRENVFTSNRTILVAVFAVLGAVALMVYLVVFGLR